MVRYAVSVQQNPPLTPPLQGGEHHKRNFDTPSCVWVFYLTIDDDFPCGSVAHADDVDSALRGCEFPSADVVDGFFADVDVNVGVDCLDAGVVVEGFGECEDVFLDVAVGDFGLAVVGEQSVHLGFYVGELAEEGC